MKETFKISFGDHSRYEIDPSKKDKKVEPIEKSRLDAYKKNKPKEDGKGDNIDVIA